MRLLIIIFYSFMVIQLVASISKNGNSTLEDQKTFDDTALVKQGEFKSVVALWVRFHGRNSSWCTGTALNAHTVITTAKCVWDSSRIAVYVNCPDAQCANARHGDGYNHPGFHSVRGFFTNDIGLVITEAKLPLEEFAEIAKPAPPYRSCKMVSLGNFTDKIRSGERNLYKLDVGNIKSCVEYYPRDKRFIDSLCSLSQVKNHYYFEQFGGPLFCRNKLVGITSTIIENYQPKSETYEVMVVWTIPGSYSKWLSAKMSANSHSRSPVILLVLFILRFALTSL